MKERVKVSCEVCGAVREYLPGQLRQRKVIRFCSLECRNVAARERPDVACGQCGRMFWRKSGPMRPVNYCSPACGALARRKSSLKWPDPKRGARGDRAAIREYQRQYADAHRGRLNELSARWRRTHRDTVNAAQRRRRAAERLTSVGAPVDYERIMARDQMRCHLCGGLVDRKNLHFDHVIPFSAGGEHVEANIAVAHGRCNQRKGQKVLTLF